MHGGEKRGKEMSIIFGNIIFFPYLCSIYTNHMINIRKLETELWESADLLRQGSKLTSSQYCMPVLALLFLRYAYSRYKMVEVSRMEWFPVKYHLLDKVALVVFTVLGYYTGKHHLDDDLVFLWLLAGMPVLIVSVIWGINELMAWMNGK